MSDLHRTLSQIRDRLAQGAGPAEVIAELLPRSRAEAVASARRLPLWDECRGTFPPQVVAIARVVSKRALREHGLVFDDEGRVVEEARQRPGGFKEPPAITFPLAVGGEEIMVKYHRNYYRSSGEDLFSYVGEPLPPPGDGTRPSPFHLHKPHSLSGTGWLSHHISHDAVEAVGGPEAYAALYAEAVLAERDHEFEAAFLGPRPDAVPGRRKPMKIITVGGEDAVSGGEVLGEHTARVTAEDRENSATPPGEDKPTQQTLF